VLVVFVLVYFRLGKKKGGKKVIALVGERQSGKTQMFMGLAGGKQLRTVPSIKNNSTTYQVASKPYTLIDFNGDDLSK
jgi:septin family protein